MKQILLTIILTFQFCVLSAQKTQSDLIIGKWKFDKKTDLRTAKEKVSDKNKETQIIESDDKSDLLLTFNKTQIYCNNKEFGQWETKNDSLFVYRKVSKGKEHLDKNIRDKYLEDNFLVLKKDGIYFSKPYSWNIKSLTKEILELGNEKRFSTYKRIK